MSIGTTLRNAVMVRLADPDVEPVIDWCQNNSERNSFNRDILTYPTTKVLAAYEDKPDGRVLAYLPVQGAAMLESIGPNPEVSVQELTQGLIECVQGAALMAHANGYREIYFLVSDENTALGAEYMGFREAPFKVYRKFL